MSQLSHSAQQQLLLALMQIPILQQEAGRTYLLGGLPAAIADTTLRSPATLLDLAAIIAACAAWQTVGPQESHPLDLLIENAALLVRGSELEQILRGFHITLGSQHGTIRLRVSDNTPSRPRLLIGREADVAELRRRLTTERPPNPLILHGWPGVGKTTLTIELAYDPVLQQAFPDGVLWASVGENPNPRKELAAWGRMLGLADLADDPALDLSAIQKVLRGLLQTRRCLLIIDDVWQEKEVRPFHQLGGPHCAQIVTTRFLEVANSFVLDTTQDIYRLGILTVDAALAMLSSLAKSVVEAEPDASRELVISLERLPLALHVAGRLLDQEARAGLDVRQLLREVQETAKIYEHEAPPDRKEGEQVPTVQALFHRSTDRLEPLMRKCFACLGSIAPKPATFGRGLLAFTWQQLHLADAPEPIIKKLVDYGLLEPVPVDRYWMHAMLVTHARRLAEQM